VSVMVSIIFFREYPVSPFHRHSVTPHRLSPMPPKIPAGRDIAGGRIPGSCASIRCRTLLQSRRPELYYGFSLLVTCHPSLQSNPGRTRYAGGLLPGSCASIRCRTLLQSRRPGFCVGCSSLDLRSHLTVGQYYSCSGLIKRLQ